MCNCKIMELILGIIILVFAFLYDYTTLASWIIAIAALLLILHSLLCKKCAPCYEAEPEKKQRKPARKR